MMQGARARASPIPCGRDGSRSAVSQVDDTLLRDAELQRRRGEIGRPLPEQLPVLGIAGQADDDEQEGAEHHASPTARR